MENKLSSLKGLTPEEVVATRSHAGKNIIKGGSSNNFLAVIWGIVKEPMFILLMVAATLYFILGNAGEGFAMIVAMMFVGAISMYQEIRSKSALAALRALASPKITVIRNGSESIVEIEELVPGDLIVLSEGQIIPADAEIIEANDLTINESAMTGESLPVAKDAVADNNKLFRGSIVNSGRCVAKVTFTGMSTMLGQIGTSLSEVSEEPTQMQKSIRRFVKQLALFGFSAFLLIWITNYLRNGFLLSGLLSGLTLAMAVIPEEIPVAFSSFMALGAYYMARRGIISRNPQTIENLGWVDVLCVDKTGTLTENRMVVRFLYDFHADASIDLTLIKYPAIDLLQIARLACETEPFDVMEIAIVDAYTAGHQNSKAVPSMVFEYPLAGNPPMMTHVYRHAESFLAAAKGAPEKIIEVCQLTERREQVQKCVDQYTAAGFRVLGIARAQHLHEPFPARQEDFEWQFEGLLALYDPPRKNIPAILKRLRSGGIKIKMLTGDHYKTALAISLQTALTDSDEYLKGDDVMNMSGAALQKACEHTDIFGRMFPEAKLRVINAIRSNGHVVAMIGDGINDGPALKAADIGIAMGRNGTEIARQASDLILTDDNLEKVEDAIRQGKKISSNFRKAIRYIISIHIPIILTATLPVLFGWKYANIFTPIHIIFLELIMGPTCSVFFEREPYETSGNDMVNADKRLLPPKDIFFSLMQGLIISIGILLLYYNSMNSHALEETRTIVFITIVVSNLFLTFVNRSFKEDISRTIKYKNNLTVWIVITTVSFIALILFVKPVNILFGLAGISVKDYMLVVVTAIVATGWPEIFKLLKRRS